MVWIAGFGYPPAGIQNPQPRALSSHCYRFRSDPCYSPFRPGMAEPFPRKTQQSCLLLHIFNRPWGDNISYPPRDYPGIFCLPLHARIPSPAGYPDLLRPNIPTLLSQRFYQYDWSIWLNTLSKSLARSPVQIIWLIVRVCPGLSFGVKYPTVNNCSQHRLFFWIR